MQTNATTLQTNAKPQAFFNHADIATPRVFLTPRKSATSDVSARGARTMSFKYCCRPARRLSMNFGPVLLFFYYKMDIVQ